MSEDKTHCDSTAVQEQRKRVQKGLQEDGLKVVLAGRVKNGRIELDQSQLETLAKEFPDREMAFFAVNAPFDPTPTTTQ